MAQSFNEIKEIIQCNGEPGTHKTDSADAETHAFVPARTISRDRKPRDIYSEEPLLKSNPLISASAAPEAALTSARRISNPDIEKPIPATTRRDFFQTIVPASGQLLAGFLRNIGTTVGALTEDVTKNTNAGSSNRRKSD